MLPEKGRPRKAGPSATTPAASGPNVARTDPSSSTSVISRRTARSGDWPASDATARIAGPSEVIIIKGSGIKGSGRSASATITSRVALSTETIRWLGVSEK
jgi:hypothetical protein